jgi:hypothetical protein
MTKLKLKNKKFVLIDQDILIIFRHLPVAKHIFTQGISYGIAGRVFHLTFMKGRASSPAIACANRVLPQPGGPCSRNPRGGVTPSSLHGYKI